MPDGEERKITAEYIKHVQNMIEDCLQMYMNRKDTVNILMQQANIDPGVTKLVWQKLEEQNEDFFRAYHVRLLVIEQTLMFNHLLKQQADIMKRVNAMKNVHHAPEFTSVPCYRGFSLTTGSPRHENMFVRPGAAGTNVMENYAPLGTQHIQQYNHGVNGRAMKANAMIPNNAPFGNQGVHEYNHDFCGSESNADVMINTPFHNQSKCYNHDVFGRESQPNVIINSTPFSNHGYVQNNHGVSGEESNNNLLVSSIPFRNQGIKHTDCGASGVPNVDIMISNTSLGKCIQQSNHGVREEQLKTNQMTKSTTFGNQGIQHINHSSSGGELNANLLIQSAPLGNQGFYRMQNGYSGAELNANVMIKDGAFGNQSNDSNIMNSISSGNQGNQRFYFGMNETLVNTSTSLTPHGVLPDVAFNSSDFGQVFVNDPQVNFKSSRSNILDHMGRSISFSSFRDPPQNHDNFEDYGKPTFFQSDSNVFWDSGSA